MALTDMKVFDDWLQGTAVEVDAQFTELFNGATRNALRLQSGSNAGDFSDVTFFKDIPNLHKRRDPYANGAIAPVALTQEVDTSVKIAGGSFPMLYEPQQFTYILKDPREAGIAYGKILGKLMVKDKLDTAISASVAAMANAGHTFTAAGNLTRGDTVQGAGLFGDRQGDIAVWVTHSKPMTDLYGENTANVQRLFNIDNINVSEDGFGRIIVMTDSASLVNGANYNTLGLVAGAVTIEDNGDLYSVTEEITGFENIRRQTQSEYTYNLQLKGYRFDKSTAGAGVTDVDIADGTKWVQNQNDVKNTAGIVVVST